MGVKISKGEQTRQRIIAAAMDLFAESGYSRTSIQNIANRCGLSQSAVLQHFKTKENLLSEMRLAVSRSNHEWVDGKIELSDDAFTALSKHMYENINWAHHHRRQAQIIVLTYYFGCYDRNHLEVNKDVVKVGTQRILRYVLAGQRERAFHFEEAPERIAEILHEYLLGAFVRTIASSWLAKPPAGLKDKLDSTLKKILVVSGK